MNPLIIILLVVLWLILLSTVLLWATRRLGRRREKEILTQFDAQKIVLQAAANFFGQQSRGRGQLRGNGLLILTNDELYFAMWWPRREWRLPRGKITGAEIVKSFLGRTRFQPLLKINFLNATGQADIAAWLVAEPEKWQEKIGELIFI